MPTVALVGADGAGKSTIAREVVRRLGDHGRYLYMGINLEASNLMLPSTRLVLELKRRKGGRPDLAPPRINGHAPVPGRRRSLANLKTDLRFANQIAEEWFRQLAAWYHLRRGIVVIFDRHFVWDYQASFTIPGSPHTSVIRKWHDELLRQRYPRPDLVICLDAPGDVLLRRKAGGTVEERERRRREYLEIGAQTPGFTLVNVDRPQETVIQDVMTAISTFKEHSR